MMQVVVKLPKVKDVRTLLLNKLSESNFEYSTKANKATVVVKSLEELVQLLETEKTAKLN